MKMKLLYTQNSPYARKVRIIATDKHIELEQEEVVLANADNAANQYNPLGKVPVLILPNGDAIYDSPVIAEYLDKKSPVANLIPVDNEERVQVKRWEALADGICDAAVAVMLEQRRAVERQDDTFVERQARKVTRGLSAFEQVLEGQEWVAGVKYGLADIALACAVGYVAIRFEGEIDMAATYPNLHAFYARLLERPVYAQTQPAPKY